MKNTHATVGRRGVALLLGLILAASSTASSTPPVIGQRVADLEDDVVWLQGQQVPRFERGKVYVVDLWATWCAACIGFMAHLSSTAQQYAGRGLEVIGIAVDHHDGAIPPESFVRSQGSRMKYSVAAEAQPGRVSPKFADPKYRSMPFLAIIDREGRLAWTSGPDNPHAGFDEALAQIIEGTYNLLAAAEKSRRIRSTRLKAEPLVEELQKTWERGSVDQLHQRVNQLMELDPDSFAEYGVRLFTKMLQQRMLDKAHAYGLNMLHGLMSNQVNELIRMERALLSTAGIDRREMDLALAIAERANTLRGGKDPDFLLELAQVNFRIGQREQALEYLRHARGAAKQQNWGSDYLRLLDHKENEFRAGREKK